MHFLPTAARVVAAAALALAVANVVYLWSILLGGALSGEQRFSWARLVIQLVLLSLGPLLVVAMVRRRGRVSYSLEPHRLGVERRGGALREIPFQSISEVRLP